MDKASIRMRLSRVLKRIRSGDVATYVGVCLIDPVAAL